MELASLKFVAKSGQCLVFPLVLLLPHFERGPSYLNSHLPHFFEDPALLVLKFSPAIISNQHWKWAGNARKCPDVCLDQAPAVAGAWSNTNGHISIYTVSVLDTHSQHPILQLWADNLLGHRKLNPFKRLREIGNGWIVVCGHQLGQGESSLLLDQLQLAELHLERS